MWARRIDDEIVRLAICRKLCSVQRGRSRISDDLPAKLAMDVLAEHEAVRVRAACPESAARRAPCKRPRTSGS